MGNIARYSKEMGTGLRMALQAGKLRVSDDYNLAYGSATGALSKALYAVHTEGRRPDAIARLFTADMASAARAVNARKARGFEKRRGDAEALLRRRPLS